MRDQDAGAAIEQLRCALEVARGQGARWFELRAARDLAHLLAAQGNRQSAHNLLAPVYLGFAEGLGAPDLKEAKALLTKLAGAGRKARYPEGRV